MGRGRLEARQGLCARYSGRVRTQDDPVAALAWIVRAVRSGRRREDEIELSCPRHITDPLPSPIFSLRRDDQCQAGLNPFLSSSEIGSKTDAGSEAGEASWRVDRVQGRVRTGGGSGEQDQE